LVRATHCIGRIDSAVVTLRLMDSMISVEELRDLMDRGKPVTVVDVRTTADRADWWITGSRHVDAYDALKAGEEGPLGSLDSTVQSPVVTVCGVGKTAALATQHLRARGLNALTLAGGMRAWSLAWNTAEIELPGAPAQIVQIRRTGKGCLSYLLGSDREAVVIDPSVDSAVYVEEASRRGWRITQVLETHVHADHVSRARQLAEQTGATLRLPAQNRVQFDNSPVHEGEEIKVGTSKVTALRTPGHTAESTCYLVGGAVFTGDTLFLAAVGRPDLGTASGDARDRATALFRSLKRLLALPPTTIVLPGHSSQPIAFDRIPVGADIGEIGMRLEPMLRDESEFVANVLGRLPAPPPNYAAIVSINESGTWTDGDFADLEAGGNRCAVA
jgi:glyoxylase-like metal-dependent hydrolase (beta-lactamase superfamily II)